MTEPADLVRSTTRAIASTVRDVPPLRLAAAPDELAAFAPPSRRGRRSRRSRGWLAPAAAALAVAAVALSVVGIRDSSNGRAAPPATAVSADRVPPYYVTLAQQAGQSARTPLAAIRNDLVIGSARTGKRLGTLTPPTGSTFFGVTAAADGRTFVVDTLPVGKVYNPTGARTWYLLRPAPGGAAPARLTRLAVPRLANVSAIALSGSGTELAVATGGGGALAGVGIAGGSFPPSLPGVLRLYSVSTGRLLRAWSTRDLSVFGSGPGLTSENNTELTWVDDDHAIAFFSMWVTPVASGKPGKSVDHETVRVLNVAAAGRQLLADSRVTWSLTESAQPLDHPGSCIFGEDVLVTADGNSIVCLSITNPSGPYHKGLVWTVRWLAYSTAAPAVARVLETITVPESFPSGLAVTAEPVSASSPAIIAIWCLLENNHPAADIHVGLIRAGSVSELPVKLVIGGPGSGFPAIAW